MENKLIISEQPTCKTCGELMKEWNPFAESHEHIECTSERVSNNIFEVIYKQLKPKKNDNY